MGTRAQFFIGNPEDLEKREFLGCIAWDGYPDGDCGKALRHVKTAGGFRRAVSLLAKQRDDFTDPNKRSFPFPWHDDLFLTDLTYAFFDGAVRATWFHGGWRPLEYFFTTDEPYPGNLPDELPHNVPAPVSDKPPGADSIMIITARAEE